MRVIVTGGSGRLGRSVVRDLVNCGHDVLNADLRDFSGDPASRFMPVDCLELGQICSAVHAFGAEAIVHLAALPSPLFYPEEVTFRTNVLTTFNVFQAAVVCGIGRMVYAGSPTPLGISDPRGWQPDYLPIDEQHPFRPRHSYALSKAIGEEILQTFIRQTDGRLRAQTIRPLFVVAPEDWPRERTNQRGEMILQRLNDLEEGSRNLFNYVDARDAAQAFRLALEAIDDLPNGDAFYAGASDALAPEPLAELLPRFYPAWGHLASALTGSRPAVSSEKAQRMLGYAPSHSWRIELGDVAGGREPLPIERS